MSVRYSVASFSNVNVRCVDLCGNGASYAGTGWPAANPRNSFTTSDDLTSEFEVDNGCEVTEP